MSNATLIARIHDLCASLQPKPTSTEAKLAPLEGIKAVLFDIYGTLLISASGDIGLESGASQPLDLRSLLSAAGISWAGEDGGPPSKNQAPGALRERLSAAIQADHRLKRARGTQHPEVEIRRIWATVLAEVGLQPTPSQLERIALEYECLVNPVWPMPGLDELLSALRERGLVLGIVSNAQFYTPLILQAFLGQSPDDLGLEPSCSAWSYQLGEAKPSLALYQLALDGLAQKHGIRPEQVLYIGNDRRNDIWPAQQLGLKTALFAGDARSLRLREGNPTLTGVTADRLVTELAQISRLIGSSAPIARGTAQSNT